MAVPRKEPQATAGKERRRPGSAKGQHGAPAPSPGHKLQERFGNHRTQDAMKQSDSPAPSVQPGEAVAAIKRRTSWWGNLDESALGADLLAAAEGGRFQFCNAVLEELHMTDRDDVSLAFMEHLPADEAGERRLDVLAASDAGRRLLDRLLDELTSGVALGDERRQADRIFDAKTRAMRTVKSKMIFPYRAPGLAEVFFPAAPISAKRLPDGRVWVKLPMNVRDVKEFKDEVHTLHPNVFISGIEIPENTIIRVKMYDLGGEVHEKPALYLVQLSNDSDTKTAYEVAELAFLLASSGGMALGRRAIAQDFRLTFTQKGMAATAETKEVLAGLFRAGGLTKKIKKAGAISGSTSLGFNIYYQVKGGRGLRDLDVLAAIIDFVLGAVFGVVIAKVWRAVPLKAELKPLHIARELLARRPGPALETIGTLVRQQITLLPVATMTSLARAFAFKRDPKDALTVVLVDVVAGMVAGYFLQIIWLNKPGQWVSQLAYRRILTDAELLDSGWAAFSRSVLGQARQAVLRDLLGMGPKKKKENQNDKK